MSQSRPAHFSAPPTHAGILPRPEVAVAVAGIAFNLNSLLWMAPNALGMALSAHVGNALGAAEPAQAKLAVQVAHRPLEPHLLNGQCKRRYSYKQYMQ